MTLTKTKIETFDYSWNPVTGCNNGCDYCYARVMTVRFPKRYPCGFTPMFWPERMNDLDKLPKKGTKQYTRPFRVFTVSMGDLFSPGMKFEWQKTVIDKLDEHPDHQFFISTKRPDLIPQDIEFPDNLWVAVTVEDMSKSWRIKALFDVPVKHRYLNVEPMWGAITAELSGFGWMIMGPQTNPDKVPSRQIVEETVATARNHGIPVYAKEKMWKEFLPGKRPMEFP